MALGSTPAVLPLLLASVRTLAATEMVPLAFELTVGVKIAEYAVPDPVKFESEPPATVTSPAAKFVEASLSLKAILADSPILRADLSLVIVTVGRLVSERTNQRPKTLPLPAASVNLSAST